MALEKELDTYHRRLPELLKDEGKFVVIQGEEVAGAWDTYEDALKAAYEKYKLTPFFVKQILAVEPVLHFTRDVTTCRS
jgi:hypothetical protein